MASLLLAFLLWIPAPAENGRLLLTAAPKWDMAYVYDLAGGRLLMSRPFDPSQRAFLTARGRILVIIEGVDSGPPEDRSLRLQAWDVENQELVDDFSTWDGQPPDQVFFDDDFRLLALYWSSGRLQIINRSSRQVLHETELPDRETAFLLKAVFSPDLASLVWFREGELGVWRFSENQPRAMPWDLGLGINPVIVGEKEVVRCGAIHSEDLTGLYFLDLTTVRMSIRCGSVFEMDITRTQAGMSPPIAHAATFEGQIGLGGGGRYVSLWRDRNYLITLSDRTVLAEGDEDTILAISPDGSYWIESDPANLDQLTIHSADSAAPCTLDLADPRPCPIFKR